MVLYKNQESHCTRTCWVFWGVFYGWQGTHGLFHLLEKEKTKSTGNVTISCYRWLATCLAEQKTKKFVSFVKNCYVKDSRKNNLVIKCQVPRQIRSLFLWALDKVRTRLEVGRLFQTLSANLTAGQTQAPLPGILCWHIFLEDKHFVKALTKH